MAILYFLKWLILESLAVIAVVPYTIAKGCVWLFAARGCMFCANEKKCNFASRLNPRSEAHIAFWEKDGIKSLGVRETQEKTSECIGSIWRKHFYRRDDLW